MNLTLRHYQEEGIKLLRESFSKGYKRTILWLATGGGKTATFCFLIFQLFNNNKKVLIVIRRRELIFQTQKQIEKFTGLKASIIMGKEKGFDPKCRVQICSIDTISRRISNPKYYFLLDFDFLIVDECHDSTSPKYKNFLNLFADKYWIGLTATPFNTGSKYLTDWEDIVNPITAKELRDEGFLVPEKTYAPKKIDVSGIKISGGDFDNRALAERASDSSIVGDIVQTWKEYGDNRPTILFAVNKEHSKLMAEAFRQQGVPAIHQDESHSSQERQNAIEGLKSGRYKILCNVNIFSTGVDIPQVGCGIFARPTKSEILYVQQVGRILRPYKVCGRCGADCGAEQACFRCGSTSFRDIKEDAILLDHANNCERFGLAFDKRYARIRPPTKKRNAETDPDLEIKTKTCESCFAVYSAENTRCPMCDHQNAKTEREIKEEEGELQRVKSEELRYSIYIKIKNDLMKLSNPKWKESAKWIKLHSIYGDIIFDFREELEMPRWAKIQISKAQQSSTKIL